MNALTYAITFGSSWTYRVIATDRQSARIVAEALAETGKINIRINGSTLEAFLAAEGS